ncbi:MAG TPA: TetR/AcrR family transcriptional regulator [Gordonia sp. (in: high G+C Gram-positive bacteria)]|uniref:TetR/AcrR family transcriptional regulator n=1 Tax=unclassified Gordonia (in: high G+C Gram-positive bacteria) TaxID=2657482 RepID=UPI000FAB3BE5|nr:MULTISPECIES: TetR/AcrR family transcriptional regulator [unclassified Gordonia (in: high G+C Gram-positive bacteria)]RUP40266.1 MAG: TetR/AcrR family transcriptional regulator [Gordonia sp. (in: high G+C Gram-positive bacteria)]HNP58440.1 TetR/AcrR family transcriptional regulator [Gordonia sp. (in: high G+C Gram-positive bacteria)]HRC52018.1 TetR/AcrR family transcriptional regulator [Gordonia sp. (in: high G+C Gram-positive bacteria)]
MRTRGWQGDLPQDSDEARARILAAAASCVERYGAQKTRLADVASELGVTRQTVYRYYSSVDEMLVAVATAGTADFLDRMAVALSDVHTPQDAITETIIYCLRVLPDEPMIGLMVRAGETEFFTREATSASAVALGAQMLRRLDVDWAAHGYDDDAMAGLAELVMRVWLSFLQYPANPPRSDDDLREFIRTWVCPCHPAARTAGIEPSLGDG